MAITFDYFEDLERILQDLSTPPYDVDDILDAVLALGQTPDFLPDQLGPVREAVELYEFVLPGRGHRYGFLVEERMEGYEIVAYYRIPPIIGYSRERAIEKALDRRSQS